MSWPPDFGQKQGCAEIVVKSKVLEIKQFVFHQKMQAESGYQTAVSDFGYSYNVDKEEK